MPALCVPFAPALPKPAPKASAKKDPRSSSGSPVIPTGTFAPKVTIEQVIEKTSALGVPGSISFTARWTARTPPICATQAPCLLERVDLICLSIHQDFVSPDADPAKNIEHTKKCIRLAHEMGIPSIRLNSGRWGTARDFNHLMELRGKEPILPATPKTKVSNGASTLSKNACPRPEARRPPRPRKPLGTDPHPRRPLRIANAIDSPGWASSWTPETSWRTPTTS